MRREPIEVPVEPAIMQWLRTSAGWTHADVSKKLGLLEESYNKIETGEKKPTLRQIEMLAKAFHRPIAAFLLPSPAQEPSLPQDFRQIPNDKREFSRKMRRVFRKARWLQDSSKELMTNLSLGLDPLSSKHTISDEPAQIAASERSASGITLETQIKWKNSYEAFAKWRDFLERKNIRTFQVSMPIEEARGFSLVDKKPFLVVVNSADDINARIFTLFHEYGHILLSETSVCIPELSSSKDSSKTASVERWCNRFAAEFILPSQVKDYLVGASQYGSQHGLGKMLHRGSTHLKVSKYALLIRMKEFGLVKDTQMTEFIEQAGKAIKKKGGGGKGLTQLDRCKQERGSNYVSLVLENLDRGAINTKDALGYLSIQMKYLDSLRSRQKSGKNG
ncbi:XRE family transcriptional regulator [Candidatus Micrarchaeota archaeon]|nr:XRE family transcriptional regulator [Candidatus Micrarchaeota archaeon]